MIREYWFSCDMFTVWIKTETDRFGVEVIVAGAPVIRKFIGGNYWNLKQWARLKSPWLDVMILREYQPGLPEQRQAKTIMLKEEA